MRALLLMRKQLGMSKVQLCFCELENFCEVIIVPRTQATPDWSGDEVVPSETRNEAERRNRAKRVCKTTSSEIKLKKTMLDVRELRIVR